MVLAQVPQCTINNKLSFAASKHQLRECGAYLSSMFFLVVGLLRMTQRVKVSATSLET